MKYQLHTMTWKTKRAARKWVQDLLNSTDPGQFLPTTETLIVFNLLQRHPRYNKHYEYTHAIGIKVDRHAAYGNNCFHTISPGRDPMPFSYISCFSPPTPNMNIRQACRRLIYDQITQFKLDSVESNGLIKCAVSGEFLPIEDIDVDHDFSSSELMFHRLVDKFIASIDIPPKDIKVQYIKRTNIVKFYNESLNVQWLAYHKEHARLRCLKREINQRGTL